MRSSDFPGSLPPDAEPAREPEHPPQFTERELLEIISGQLALYRLAADCRRAQREANQTAREYVRLLAELSDIVSETRRRIRSFGESTA
ncbi:MAG TPA: hypothetical protein VNQ78_09865 [Paracoccus sp. (in: a-proteobacteria)]|uniref:hypothetical protein n=1 Tax=Paracoccus sp. TaxID=267 RepID=UPI002CE9F1F9|nr:hypothetical protein [Paracoccus sp. (in: a-proteobacteria)]HWL56964.1 hypothetical protein [Paracoccus sp. (in: a-proteobacteria)]